MPTGDLTLYTSGYSLLEKTKLAQSEQRRQETLDSSGRPKVERFFIEDTYSVVAPRAAAPSVGVSTTTFTSSSFTTDFATSPTPTVFPTPSPSPSAGFPSGFIPDFSSGATEFADPSQAAGGGPDLALDRGYVDEPNRFKKRRVGLQQEAFLVISNVNKERDDNFILQIRPPSGSQLITVPGLLDFTETGTATTYTYLSKNLTLEEFFNTDVFKEIDQKIVAQSSGGPRRYNSPAFRLTPDLRIDKKLPDDGGYVSAELRMRNVQRNLNNNFGAMYYGFLKDGVVYQSVWSGTNGVDMVYSNFDWQKNSNSFRTVLS
jgi:hypothetical protein